MKRTMRWRTASSARVLGRGKPESPTTPNRPEQLPATEPTADACERWSENRDQGAAGKGCGLRLRSTARLLGIIVNARCSPTSSPPRTGATSKFRHSIDRTDRI